MLERLKGIIKQYFLFHGFLIKKINNYESAESLIRSIHVYYTGHPLVRLGGDTDGGYVIPNDLVGIKSCFSPGVSNVSNFEIDLAKRDIKSFLIDGSVEGPAVKHEMLKFDKLFLDVVDGDDTIRLDSWIKNKDPDLSADSILQMDIEGAELSILNDIDEKYLTKFRIIVIEFHSMDSIFDEAGLELLKTIFHKLCDQFYIVHIHPNNCCPVISFKEVVAPTVLEFTFLRKDRATCLKRRDKLETHLDRPNIPSRPPIRLSKNWL